MKIYTKNGDLGFSSTINSNLIPKSSPIFKVMGSIDEAIAWIGILSTLDNNPTLLRIQNQLFTINSILAGANLNFDSEQILLIENEIDKMEEKLPTLKNFILPGGSLKNSYAHLTRTIIRKSERYIMELDLNQKDIIAYLNRISDYFFVLARSYSLEDKKEEIIWKLKN